MWHFFEIVLLILDGVWDYVLSFFSATACNIQQRAEEAAIAPIEDALPRGWTKKRSWLGRIYYFDHLTLCSSLERPVGRQLYESLPLPESANARLRVAVLVPSDDFDSTLECLLVDVNVHAAAKGVRLARLVSTIVRRITRSTVLEEHFYNRIIRAYGWCDCLSYCCGDPRITDDVIVNGHLKAVTVNLVAALRHFRSLASRKPVMLWIDALCINQDDPQDKAIMISLLDVIFQMAPVVQMWLGPDQSLEQALLALDAAVKDEIETGVELITRFVAGMEQPDLMMQRFQTLYSLPYWTRKWIVQEMCLARKVALHVGRLSTVPMNQETLARYIKLLYEYLKVRVPVDSLSPTCFAVGRILKSIGDSGDLDSEQRRRIPFLVSSLRRTEASLPADSVYAILSLFGNLIRVTPNYDKSIRVLFTEVTLQLFEACGSLNLLCQACSKRSDLPSWVPDFSHPPVEFLGYRYGTEEGYALSNAHFELVSGTRLRTSALFIDTVKAVCPVHQDTNLVEDGPSLQIDPAAERLLEWASFCRENFKQHTVIQMWEWIFLEMHPQTFDMPGMREKAKSWAEFVTASLGTESAPSDEVMQLTARLSTLSPPEHTTVFATEAGRWGFVRSDGDVCTGDRITNIATADMPFCSEILRHASGGISVIRLKSPCYVDGIMSSGTLSEAALHGLSDDTTIKQKFEYVVIV